jgi:hypothetical protein
MSVYLIMITVGKTYAGKIAVLPEQGASDKEEVLKIEHSGHGVGKEAQEMWERDVGDAVGWRVLLTILCDYYNTTAKENLPVHTQ